MIDDALQRLIGAHLGHRVHLSLPAQRVSGGFWAAIYSFQLDPVSGALAPMWSGKLILRVMPNRARGEYETIVQRAVAETGFPTPRVLLAGFDEQVGGAYMVMPFARGKPPLSGLKLGSMFELRRSLRRLPDRLAGVAVRLHAVDPRPIVDALQAAGLTVPSEGWRDRLDLIDRATRTPSTGFDALLRWFDAHRPVDPAPVLCHGDLHPFNLLVDDDGTTTVLDWTNAGPMPREFEVGFAAGLLRCAPIRVPRIAEPVVRRLEANLASRFIARYRESAPLDAALLEWFEALQYARCLAEVATARAGLSTVVHAQHPFETSAAAMAAELARLTGVTVELGPRSDV
jgi:aminoglycoside phosphotransferase (APT) family kinase protein